MKKSCYAFVAVFSLSVFGACATLLNDDDIKSVKQYETGTYILKKDIINSFQEVLKKGERVKLLSASTDEYVKIYAYSEKETFLESKRFLMLYLFEEAFPADKTKVEDSGSTLGVTAGYAQLGREGYEKYLADKRRKMDSSKFVFSKEKLDSYLSEYVQPVEPAKAEKNIKR